MRHLFGLAAFCALACAPAAVQAQPAAASAPVLSAEDWRARTRVDLAAFADAARQNYIYAAYPDPARWRGWFDRALASVEAELAMIRDEAGYQAVLRHMAALFQDAHVSIRFEPSASLPSNWPGFLARFDDGTYRITASRQTNVADGAEVSACDGRPMSWWITTIARYEVGLPDSLETTRNIAALRLFVDRGSPLRPRPVRCVIAGRSVALDWAAVSSGDINPIIASLRGGRTPQVSTRLIGSDGAWVRLGYFQPGDAAQAQAFHAAIAAAPSLRDRRFIVLDVRGNGGGPYNWFMAYLRGLYGQAYADHHAIARLHIRGVFRLSPAYVQLDRDDASEASDFGEPADPPYESNEAADHVRQRQAVAAGDAIFRATPRPMPPRGAAPPNPVRAQVYVLTDHACASACIGFVDELKLFPGVRQIGLSTSVDSRSGTAVDIVLPSGQATVSIAAMTRDGRLRDDNEPHLPAIRFPGDIRDDAAVESWFLNVVRADDQPN